MCGGGRATSGGPPGAAGRVISRDKPATWWAAGTLTPGASGRHQPVAGGRQRGSGISHLVTGLGAIERTGARFRTTPTRPPAPAAGTLSRGTRATTAGEGPSPGSKRPGPTSRTLIAGTAFRTPGRTSRRRASPGVALAISPFIAPVLGPATRSPTAARRPGPALKVRPSAGGASEGRPPSPRGRAITPGALTGGSATTGVSPDASSEAYGACPGSPHVAVGGSSRRAPSVGVLGAARPPSALRSSISSGGQKGLGGIIRATSVSEAKGRALARAFSTATAPIFRRARGGYGAGGPQTAAALSPTVGRSTSTATTTGGPSKGRRATPGATFTTIGPKRPVSAASTRRLRSGPASARATRAVGRGASRSTASQTPTRRSRRSEPRAARGRHATQGALGARGPPIGRGPTRGRRLIAIRPTSLLASPRA